MSALWYWMEDDRRRGPITTVELKESAKSGKINPGTKVQKEGMAASVTASQVKGLFDMDEAVRENSSPEESATHRARAATAFHSARDRAAELAGDLKNLNWREEVLPIDSSSLRELSRDYVFWCVALLGTVPLLIWTINRPDYQLTGFALFFAALWGVAFKYFVIRDTSRWGWPVASLLFTGIVGIPVLRLLYQVLPTMYVAMPHSRYALISLAGMVFQVGLWEEILKAVPVVAYLAWNRRHAIPTTALLVGVFSGLGFAAFENVSYGDLSVAASYDMAQQFGAAGHVLGVREAMAMALSRSLSLVFCHAVWAGIAAYFLVLASLTVQRAAILVSIGILVAAILHGSYNWLTQVQLTFAAGIAAGSFVLFYAYVTKLKNLEK